MEFLILMFLCALTVGVPAAAILFILTRWLCRRGRESSFMAWGLFLPVLTVLLSGYCIGACFEVWPFFWFQKLDGWGGMLWPLDILIYCVPIWIGTVGSLIGALTGTFKKKEGLKG